MAPGYPERPSSPSRGHPIPLLEEHVLAIPLSLPRSRELPFDAIDDLLGLRDGLPLPLREALAAARARAELLGGTIAAPASTRIGGLAYAAEATAALWLDRPWSRPEVTRLVEGLAAVLAEPEDAVRAALFAQAVRQPHVLELPPQLGSEVILQLLLAFTGATSASLWTGTESGRPAEVVHAGDGEPTRRARAAAREAIESGRQVTSERSFLHALPVHCWGEPAAALVLRCQTEVRTHALALASEAAVALVPVVEFDTLLDRNVGREQSLTQASERQLTRLGFDLHDGPMQDIAALAADLRLFRSQLAEVIHGSDRAGVLVGRVDDLEARLVSVDRELRELAHSLQSPAGVRLPLVDSIRHELDSFRSRSKIDARFSADGDFDALTASQRIALVRVVQEALSNVREHSGARSVEVRLTATRTRLRLEVVDDGRGFDVQERLLEAAKAGRLGLVGMGERIRLLGGRFDLESRTGGPTRIRATIPRWRPLTGEG